MNKSFLEDLIKNIPSTVFNLSPEGDYLDYVPSSKFATLVPPEVFLGKNIKDLFSGELLEQFQEAIEKVSTGKEEVSTIYQLDNGYFKARFTLGSQGNIIAFVDDITDLKIAQQSLSISQERENNLAKIIDNSSNEVCLIDVDTKEILYVNKKFKENVGYSLKELMGKNFADLIYGFDISSLEDDLKNETLEKNFYQFERVKKSGEKYFVESRFRLLEENSNILVSIAEDLTEQRFLTSLLKESEDRYKTFYNYAGVSIVTTDSAFEIVDCNREFERLLENSNDKIVGKNLDLLITFNLGMLLKDFEEKLFVQSSIISASRKEKEISIQVGKLKFDNREYFQFIITDISELVRLKNEIEILKDRFELALENSELGVWDWDIVNNKIYYSKQYKKMLGYVNGDLGRTFSEIEKLIHPDDLERTKKAISDNNLGLTTIYENELRIKSKDGEYKWIYDRGKTLFNERGEPIRMVGTHTDIDKQKKAELALIEKDKVILTQSRQAAMGEMISMIAHQWRQPISTISMAVNNLLLDIELDSFEQKNGVEALNDINNQVEYLSRTIDDFKDFFKSRKKESISFLQIIENTKNIIGKSLLNHNITLESTIDYRENVFVDFNQIVQILLILINNAKDALVNKKNLERNISISIIKENETILLKVKDNASGISPSIQDRIFEPYFTTKEEKSGTGLGLYMVKNIVNKHLKGDIHFQSSEKGTEFVIETAEKNLKS